MDLQGENNSALGWRSGGNTKKKQGQKREGGGERLEKKEESRGFVGREA